MIAERLSAQLLTGARPADAAGVAHRLLAVQAQDARGVRLAIRARSTAMSAADLERALSEKRTLVITWLNRGTLHLVCSEDYFWLHALSTPRLLNANLRRLGQEGVSPEGAERALGAITGTISESGPQTRHQLRERVAAAGVRSQGQALIHLLLLASIRGLIVRGPLVGREHAYVLVRDWLGAPPRVDRGRALAELARRYLRGHGPAEDRDLAVWSGLPLRDARAGLQAIAPELEQRRDGLLDLARRPAAASLPLPRLLGAFDPVLLGWRAREWVLGHHQSQIVAGGVFRPVILIEGRAAGTWSMTKETVSLNPFVPIARKHEQALALEAQDVKRYLADSHERR
jgi:hypothetical protein